MKVDDVALIQRILAGDETAFVSLMKKYQNQVHARAFRKTGDFHIAEEITQETFFACLPKRENLERSNTVQKVALRNCRSPVCRMVQKKAITDSNRWKRLTSRK